MRFNSARNNLWRGLPNVPSRAVRREIEIEACHLIHRAETFGFKFFSNHYIRDAVLALEDLAKTVNAMGAG
jgi:hypothetical protein